MKRARLIVLTAVAFYVIALAVAWQTTASLARRKTIGALRDARQTFASISDDTIDSVLWYASRLILDEVGNTLKVLPSDRMDDIANRQHLDELNFADAKGLTVASSLPSEVGFRYDSSSETEPFLKLLEPSQPLFCYGQPCRKSVSDETRYCKYYGAAFPDRSGFMQLGFLLNRIVGILERTPASEYAGLRIGRYGHFEAVDENGDGFVDRCELDPDRLLSDGVLGERDDPEDGHVYTCDFSYVGLRFRAVIPEREFNEQRRLMMWTGGLSLAAILGFLTFFLARLSVTAEKVATLYREAEARTSADLALAQVIQRSALPRTDLFRAGQLDCAIDAVTFPAREVGGDFYVVLELTGGRILFLVADVSGKGVPAAMFVHIATNAIRIGFHIAEDVSEAVSKINDYLCEHNEAEMFVTAWFGVLDPATGDVTYVNAGHNRPYVVRCDGRVERVDGKGGLILGMFPGASYRADVLKLSPGDRLFLYTDGVTEAMDRSRRLYGEARLKALLARTPGPLCAAVKADADAFADGAERSDDLTMLTLAWYGEVPRAERTFPMTDDAPSQALDFVRAEVKLQDGKQKARLLNAVDEMTANVISYSGGKDFTLCVENIPGRCRVTLSDRGAPFNPLTHVDPDTNAPLESRPVGGLGILMTRRLVGYAAYRREDDRNVLSLVQSDTPVSPPRGGVVG